MGLARAVVKLTRSALVEQGQRQTEGEGYLNIYTITCNRDENNVTHVKH